jgi:hypothetical protein
MALPHGIDGDIPGCSFQESSLSPCSVQQTSWGSVSQKKNVVCANLAILISVQFANKISILTISSLPETREGQQACSSKRCKLVFNPFRVPPSARRSELAKRQSMIPPHFCVFWVCVCVCVCFLNCFSVKANMKCACLSDCRCSSRVHAPKCMRSFA